MTRPPKHWQNFKKKVWKNRWEITWVLLMSFLVASVLSVTHTHLLPKWLLWLIDDVVFHNLFKISHLYAKILLWVAYKVPNIPPDFPDMEKRIKFTNFIVHTIPGPVRIIDFYLECCYQHDLMIHFLSNIWRVRQRRILYLWKVKPFLKWYKEVVFDNDPLFKEVLNNEDVFYQWLAKINYFKLVYGARNMPLFESLKGYNTWVYWTKPFNNRKKAIEYSHYVSWRRYLWSLYSRNAQIKAYFPDSVNYYGYLFNRNRLLVLRFFIYLSYVKKSEGFEFIHTEENLKIIIDSSIMKKFNITDEVISQIEKDFNWYTIT